MRTSLKLSIIICTGGGNSHQPHRVLKRTVELAEFHMYVPLEEYAGDRDKISSSKSSLRFEAKCSESNLKSWIQIAFAVREVAFKNYDNNTTVCKFVSLRNAKALSIFFSRGHVVLQCESMELASTLFQSLCRHLDLKEVKSVAKFPNQFKEFQKLLERVNELKCARTSHVTDMAETTNLLKNTVVMAEDSRILGDMSATRKIYSDLYAFTFDLFLSLFKMQLHTQPSNFANSTNSYSLNNNLIASFQQRASNHQELMQSLREINRVIQVAASMRMGRAKKSVVSACRACLKGSQFAKMIEAIRSGRSSNVD